MMDKIRGADIHTNAMDFQAVFVPVDDEAVFKEKFEQGRLLLLEDGKCVLLIPYSKSESGQPGM